MQNKEFPSACNAHPQAVLRVCLSLYCIPSGHTSACAAYTLYRVIKSMGLRRDVSTFRSDEVLNNATDKNN